jgi:hypothetical protein
MIRVNRSGQAGTTTDRGCGGAQPQRVRICVEVRLARSDAIAAITRLRLGSATAAVRSLGKSTGLAQTCVCYFLPRIDAELSRQLELLKTKNLPSRALPGLPGLNAGTLLDNFALFLPNQFSVR